MSGPLAGAERRLGAQPHPQTGTLEPKAKSPQRLQDKHCSRPDTEHVFRRQNRHQDTKYRVRCAYKHPRQLLSTREYLQNLEGAALGRREPQPASHPQLPDLNPRGLSPPAACHRSRGPPHPRDATPAPQAPLGLSEAGVHRRTPSDR